MKHGHINLIVYLHIRHKWDTDVRWTLARHVSDTRSYVSYLKYIIFQLGYVSDMTGHGSDTCWTWFGHKLNTTKHGLDTTKTRPSTFFQLFDGSKKNLKIKKIKFI